ncbi:unnamed protein product [Scytosiphon promiscuus]
MAGFADSARPTRRSWRRRPRLMWLPYPLLAALSLVVMFSSVRVGESAAVAGESVTKAKTGLGAPASDIITITSANFKETVMEGTWFVKFYTDWCAHCQKLHPTWEELATDLKGEVNVGQVNCDKDVALCRRFHVAGYPTLVHVHKRRARVYKKSRKKAALKDFAVAGYKKQAAVSVLKSPFGPLENFKALIARGALRVKEFVLVQIEMGTPMWMVCLSAVAMLVVATVIVAIVVVNVKRPKED